MYYNILYIYIYIIEREIAAICLTLDRVGPAPRQGGWKEQSVEVLIIIIIRIIIIIIIIMIIIIIIIIIVIIIAC